MAPLPSYNANVGPGGNNQQLIAKRLKTANELRKQVLAIVGETRFTSHISVTATMKCAISLTCAADAVSNPREVADGANS